MYRFVILSMQLQQCCHDVANAIATVCLGHHSSTAAVWQSPSSCWPLQFSLFKLLPELLVLLYGWLCAALAQVVQLRIEPDYLPLQQDDVTTRIQIDGCPIPDALGPCHEK